MPEASFGELERLVENNSSEAELRKLEDLREFDEDRYKDAITEAYMRMMFNTKIQRVINRGKGHDKRKPGSHKEGKHK